MHIALALCAFALFALALPAQAQDDDASSAARPRVTLETSNGKIVVELYPDKAPKTVENFLGYVESGFFDGTIFHRVIKGFMVQGGGFTPDMQQKTTRAPVVNEAADALSNERGTISMARTNDPNSATAQFFINTVDNPGLDANPGSAGYTAFGRVVEGMDAVDAIAGVATGRKGQFSDVPLEAVVIKSAAVSGK